MKRRGSLKGCPRDPNNRPFCFSFDGQVIMGGAGSSISDKTKKLLDKRMSRTLAALGKMHGETVTLSYPSTAMTFAEQSKASFSELESPADRQ